MSEPLLVKRLHISGLTPSISPADLERRLSSFGKVKAMDGFGALDALGDPRKFGYVTMEIGPKALAKCLNVLSGSTWKGAKLRIGEAKPDFRERLAQLNAQPSRPVRSKRTRSRHGHPSSTLPLTPLSATAAASTPGWIVTPSGRVVRPMRMRPLRPLDPIHGETGTSKSKGASGKVKKRVKMPPIRARRCLIDPTKWDSVYLKGVFLDNISVLPTPNDVFEPPSLVRCDLVDEDDEEEASAHSDGFSAPPAPLQDRAPAPPSAQRSPDAVVTTPSSIHDSSSLDIRDEANATLAMLHRMFADTEDWDGRESVDEMEDLVNLEARGTEMPVDEVDDIQIVPRESERSKTVREGEGKGLQKSAGVFHLGRLDMEEAHDEDVEMEEISKVSSQAAEPAPQTNLKDLFAPKEDASFSLLDHLDLDLELDTDILGLNATPGVSQGNNPLSETIPPTPQITLMVPTAKARSRVTLDPSLPLLFPLPDFLPHPYTPSSATKSHQHGTPSCFLFPSATRVRGLYHLPPSNTFTRSPEDAHESIRERWEKDKPSLTREWKKAWREARTSRKGRIGAGGEIGGGY